MKYTITCFKNIFQFITVLYDIVRIDHFRCDDPNSKRCMLRESHRLGLSAQAFGTQEHQQFGGWQRFLPFGIRIITINFGL